MRAFCLAGGQNCSFGHTPSPLDKKTVSISGGPSSPLWGEASCWKRVWFLICAFLFMMMIVYILLSVFRSILMFCWKQKDGDGKPSRSVWAKTSLPWRAIWWQIRCQFFNGLSMDYPWIIHGPTMDNRWIINGFSMDNPRMIHWESTDNPWIIHVESMEAMDYLWKWWLSKYESSIDLLFNVFL